MFQTRPYCNPLNVGEFKEPVACADSFGIQCDMQSFANLAQDIWYCNSTRVCGLGGLFVKLAWMTCFAFAGAGEDRFFWDFFNRLRRRTIRLQRIAVSSMVRTRYSMLRNARRPEAITQPEAVSLMMYVDPLSAVGAWKGQQNFWKAYAQVHGMRWVSVVENVSGVTFARYAGYYWTLENFPNNLTLAADFLQNFSGINPLRHGPHLTDDQPRIPVPEKGFETANLTSPVLLRHLMIDSLRSVIWSGFNHFVSVLPQNEWTLKIDYDFSISPCCFEKFSLGSLADPVREGGGPHVILRDTAIEDYHHHCANSGFQMVRNDAVGQLYLDLAKGHKHWPAIPYADQGALAEALLELLGIEWAVMGPPPGLRDDGTRKQGQSAYRSTCLPNLMVGQYPDLYVMNSYALYCACYRRELDRLAGPYGDRRSRWVRLLDARREIEPGLLLASLFIYHGGKDGIGGRGYGSFPTSDSTDWISDERNLAYFHAWMPDTYGGPCASLPFGMHWAGVPGRPHIIYRFLNDRFPNELPLSLLENGTAEELLASYRLAAQNGKKLWDSSLLGERGRALHVASAALITGEYATSSDGCTLGSEILWDIGGRGTYDDEGLDRLVSERLKAKSSSKTDPHLG